MVRRHQPPRPPRARAELASIYLDEDVIAMLEAEADTRGTTRIAIANDIMGKLADELEGKARRAPIVPVRFSREIGSAL